MKTFLYICALLLAFCGGILCTSCRTSKPDRAAGTDLTGPYAPVVVRPDSLPKHLARTPDSVTVQPHRSLLDKVLCRTPSTSSIKSGQLHKVGKKSTVNYYYGPATVNTTTVGKKATAATAEGATATSIEKPKAPTTTGPGDATDQRGAQASANIKGDNNAPKLTNTAPEAPGPLAVLADNLTGPLGYVLAAAAVGGIIFFLIRRRARKAAENIV